jgi:uncharacterized BrkB/YihY/UPF0761 family membrane protein
MGPPPAASFDLSGDVQSVAAGADSSKGVIKDKVFNLIPPAMIVAVTLFWAFAPDAWVKFDWSMIIAGSVTTAFILALEWVHERHAGWRLNKREFATDLFYMS